MATFYAVVKRNKSGEGTHLELKVDLEYTQKVISFDKALIAEIVGLPIKDLVTAKEEKSWIIK